VILEYKTPEPV